MESSQAVRIWVRTHRGATRPFVDVQSVLCCRAHSPRMQFGRSQRQVRKVDAKGSPSKGLGLTWFVLEYYDSEGTPAVCSYGVDLLEKRVCIELWLLGYDQGNKVVGKFSLFLN